jgi:hypothetical protein
MYFAHHAAALNPRSWWVAIEGRRIRRMEGFFLLAEQRNACGSIAIGWGLIQKGVWASLQSDFEKRRNAKSPLGFLLMPKLLLYFFRCQ